MGERELKIAVSLVLDEHVTLSLREMCRGCGLPGEDLMAMVEEGLLQPQGPSPARWRFAASELERVRAALRLQRDLGLNLAGVALVLDLLDEVRALRARVRVLEQLLD